MKKKIFKSILTLALVASVLSTVCFSSSALNMGSCHIKPQSTTVATCSMWNANYNTNTTNRKLYSEIVSIGPSCTICIGAYAYRGWDGLSTEFWGSQIATTSSDYSKTVSFNLSSNTYGTVSYGRATYKYFQVAAGQYQFRVEYKVSWNNGSGYSVYYRQLYDYDEQVTYT